MSSSTPTSLSSTTGNATATHTSSILGNTLVSVADAISLHNDITKKNSNNMKFIDGTWWLDKTKNGRNDFETGPRIAKARYLDIDAVATKTADNLPHMMPQRGLQSAVMDAMGINSTDHVIVYGNEDCMFVYRVYVQMKTMGHPKELCHLMDGSLQEWIKQGGPVEEEGSSPSHAVVDVTSLGKNEKETTTYQATNPQNVVGVEELKAWIDEGKTMGENPEVLVVDARSKGRFEGTAPEPRPGLRGGRMPGAISLPITDLLDPQNKVRFKPKKDLEQILRDSGIIGRGAPSRKIVSTCGSGVTACALLTALDVLGEDVTEAYLYDGAWVQWGGRPDTPIIKD